MAEREPSLDNPIPLQEWVTSHPVSNEMYWRGGYGYQVRYVSDYLAPLVGTGLDYDQIQRIPTVISTHTSKSILLPVYQLTRPDQDLKIVLRNNFHDWKMSVLSETPIQPVFDGLFHTTPPVEPEYTGDELHPVYFEGFPLNLIFPYYSETDGKQWSAEIHGDEPLWTAIFLMMRSLGHIKAREWLTKESHRMRLDQARNS